MQPQEISQPQRWREARPISEEAVRGLHLPNYRHRFSAGLYPSGTAFGGTRRASTCYVLRGSCEFRFGDQSVAIEAGYLVSLPAGDFTFCVVGQSDVDMLCVFALPFDVVHHRRDGVEYLEDNGIHAIGRDWMLGETLVAYQLPQEYLGIMFWKEAICLAPEHGTWFVLGITDRSYERRSLPDLKAACDHVVAMWLKPNWRRLHRDDAKRLLARCRAAGLSEQIKLESLDEYSAYETADVHDAIRKGELPELDEAAVALLVRRGRPDRFPRELEPLIEDGLVHDLKYALNAYIREELRTHGHELIVEGQMELGGLCPCCEHFTIDPGEDGLWDICPLCEWENGGDSPNHITLHEAKKNFEACGASRVSSLAHLAVDRMRKFRRAWPQPVTRLKK